MAVHCLMSILQCVTMRKHKSLNTISKSELQTQKKLDNVPNRKETALNLKAPIATSADDKFYDIFPNFRQK